MKIKKMTKKLKILTYLKESLYIMIILTSKCSDSCCFLWRSHFVVIF